jgi:UDP-N-acetylglucosamine 2-epimerase (non-hydrolysing)
MAPVLKALKLRPGQISSTLCVTGQHRAMLDQVLQLFDIKPDVDLNLMRPNQTLAGLTVAALGAIDKLLEETKPDWVLAQGDTTTVLAAAMACFYRQVRFGHIEAGLRTGDRLRPFPEEVNRRIADLLADLYFAPTESARQALLAEHVAPDRIVVTGNTVVDALLDVAARPYDWHSGPLSRVPRNGRIVLITAHRRESFGEPFRDLCLAIRELAESFEGEDIQFVYPVHLNPNVRGPVMELLAGRENIILLEPIDYISMAQILKRSTLVLTDSGGIQEEAPTFGVPVLVMRDTTERPEGVAAGLVRLVGTDRSRIIAEASAALAKSLTPDQAFPCPNPYGDGRAADRIVQALLDYR